jgi:hypothetical protein
MLLRVAVGHPNGVFLGLRHRLPTQGKARGVQTIVPKLNLFLLADGKRYFAEHHVTAVGEDFVQAPIELEAVEKLCGNPLAKKEFPGFVFKKR